MESIRGILDDAERLAEEAEAEMGRNLRNAAEKAWSAVARATDALLLKYTGREPDPRTRTEVFDDLIVSHTELLPLNDTYHAKMALLHGECSYLNRCSPERTIQQIRRVRDYINEVRKKVY